jgi:hypothetical protein
MKKDEEGMSEQISFLFRYGANPNAAASINP